METEDSIAKRSERVRNALEDAFGVRSKTLARAVRKTGRRLPRRLRGDAAQIVLAEGYGGNPKLLRAVDGASLAAAEGRLVDWLASVDRADARRGYWIGIGAMIGFNILLGVAVIVFWMWWTGRV